MLQALLDMIASKVLFFALHLSNTGSFPPPLSAEEEHNCLLAYAAGDQTARDKLIEHNLRLVVHVIKNSYNKGQPHFCRTPLGQAALFLGEYPASPAAYRPCCIRRFDPRCLPQGLS